MSLVSTKRNPYTSSTTDVLVGKARTKFTIPRVLVPSLSQHQSPIVLPHVDPTIFPIYLHWRCTSELAVLRDPPGTDPESNLEPEPEPESESESESESLDLAKACLLGHDLHDDVFQHAVLQALTARIRSPRSPGADLVEFIYNHHEKFPASVRAALVDVYVQFGNPRWLAEWKSPFALPRPFLMDLSLGFLERNGRNGWEGSVAVHLDV
ncbi:hypothetical protein EYZ11_010803 [Aspergillus tanneri]|uniref:Uncharacterized protein n=1 Tax=Aspergillus tanneri TaxID=1220188 RepID=A0A4S3J9V5_9EURO|nr:hypothetical protein EYZ11_010803 [Aspergillus tanneri]